MFLRDAYVNSTFMASQEVIAHRGASAYAPENTMLSFELAVRQQAGCVEHDLQVTKDGVLVCLHDTTLERTTNVREVFPDRGRQVHEGNRTFQRWFVYDFTLAEIRQLDAGAWFAHSFAEARIPTFDELLEWSRQRVGVLTEIKDVEVYETLGVDPLTLCIDALRRHGHLASAKNGEVTVQSFHAATVKRAFERFAGRIPVALLVEPEDWALLRDREHVAAIARFANGLGPGKAIVGDRPQVVEWAHESGLRVTPWTFRASTIGTFGTVAAEIAHYLDELHVDAVITDHPDAAVSTRV
jgi:glycerophosphoryl diester phosphodiesterase